MPHCMNALMGEYSPGVEGGGGGEGFGGKEDDGEMGGKFQGQMSVYCWMSMKVGLEENAESVDENAFAVADCVALGR